MDENMNVEQVTAVAQENDPRPENPVESDVSSEPPAEVPAAVEEAASATAALPREDGPIGTQNPEHRFFWHGRDIMGKEYIGSAMGQRECAEQATAMQSQTCHVSLNPAFVEPAIVEEPKPDENAKLEEIAKLAVSGAINAAYRAGYEDADAAYKDLKALVLAWATEQILAGNMRDTDEPAFVVYARNNH